MIIANGDYSLQLSEFQPWRLLSNEPVCSVSEGVMLLLSPPSPSRMEPAKMGASVARVNTANRGVRYDFLFMVCCVLCVTYLMMTFSPFLT